MVTVADGGVNEELLTIRGGGLPMVSFAEIANRR